MRCSLHIEERRGEEFLYIKKFILVILKDFCHDFCFLFFLYFYSLIC